MSQEHSDETQPREQVHLESVTDLETQPIPQAPPPPQTPQPIVLPEAQPAPQSRSNQGNEPQPITLSNPQPVPQNRLDLRTISTGISLEWMEKSQKITAKWLYDLGGWIFGGLLIAALLILQVLILLGFADRATLIAGLTIAIALPFNLAGLGVVRYFRSLHQAVAEARQALGQNTNLDAETLIQLTRDSEAFPPEKHKIMDSSVSLALYVSVLFTIIGLSSALWRISWAATLLFLIACVAGVLLVWRVVRSA